jgi:hypothetical protein
MFGFGFNKSKSSMDKKILNKTISDNMFKNQNKQSATASVTQTMKLSNLDYKHCNLVIKQDATVRIDVVQQVSNDERSQLISDLKQKVNDHMETVMKPKSQLFSPPQISTTVTNLKSRVENVIENHLTVENINEQISQVNSYQNEDISGIKLDACPGYEDNVQLAIATKDPEVIRAVNESCDTSKDCEISQNVRVTILAQQLTSSLVKAITEDTKVQELDTELKQKIEPEAGGLAQLAQYLTPSLGIGSCFCCLCILVIAVALFYIWDSQTTRDAVVVAGNVAKAKMAPPIP